MRRYPNIAGESYIVTDYIMTDLHHLLKAASKPLEGQFVQFFTYQMLVWHPLECMERAVYLMTTERVEIYSFRRNHPPRP